MSRIHRLDSLIGSVLLAGMVISCSSPSAEHRGDRTDAPLFVDVAQAAGIAQRHEKPRLDPRLDNIGPWMSSVGAAVAAGDFDNDGWIDLYVTNSRKGTPNYLYRNNGDGSFTDVAASAGLDRVNDETGVSMDCIWADLDNDGWQDLYLVRWGNDLVFRNNGDGSFEDVTQKWMRQPDGSPGTPWANGNAVIALDYDLDGLLDLYVGNYFSEVDLWNLQTTYIMHDSFEVARNAGRNYLYHQQDDGTFREVAQQLAVDDTGWTLAVGSADVNNDGWPDLYVANDFGPDQLYYNTGAGEFDNVTATAIGHDTRKGMNVDFGDFNNDGWLDMYVTNITTAEYLKEGNMLWRNNGPGPDGQTRFMDISPESGTYNGGWGWGAKFLDHDNDRDLDLFTVNGFVSAGEGSYWYDLASWTVTGKDPADSRSWPTMGDRSFSGYETFRFWRNDGFETFTEQSLRVGLASDRDGRGIACLDYDNDGDTDIFIANQAQPPQLFRNDSPGENHWIDLRLVGLPEAGTNADAIGARVTVVSGGEQQIRERDGGVGYAGQSDPRIHFGLGNSESVELLEVRWPDGGVQYLEDLMSDRVVVITQDPSAYAARSLVATHRPTVREGLQQEAPELPRLDPGELDRILSTMEDRLRDDPVQHDLAHTYRRRAADNGAYDRPIKFFKALVERSPDDDRARLELSVAYVDKIPTCGGLAAIVCKGTLAKKSLDIIDPIVGRRPDSWLAHYGRGMNHLHWPRALRHSPDAVADFERCLELQNASGSLSARPYFARTYVLLGDALAKSKRHDEARRVWAEGLRVFPDSRPLVQRSSLEQPAEMEDFVEAVRSLEQPIDTDFSFFDGL